MNGYIKKQEKARTERKQEPRPEERGSILIVLFSYFIFEAGTLYYVMSLTLQYNSADSSKSARRNEKNCFSPFAQATFDAFLPYINIFDAGANFFGPYHTISKESWELFRRHKQGEKPLFYADGVKFNPYNHVLRNIYSPLHVQKHLSDNETSYYTSGRHGLGMYYLDTDAHKVWQTDELKAKDLLQKLFPYGYFRPSGRGQNGYLKIRYASISEFNETATYLQTALRQLFLHHEILCDIEVKVTITHQGKSGSLAKFPFNTDVWNGQQLELFKACPVVNVRRIEQIAGEVLQQVDPERVKTFALRKQKIEQWSDSRAQIIQTFREHGFCGTDDEVFAAAKKIRDQQIKGGKWKESSSMTSCPESPLQNDFQLDGKQFSSSQSGSVQESSTSSSSNNPNTTSAGPAIYSDESKITGKGEVPNGRKNTSPLQSCLSEQGPKTWKQRSLPDVAATGASRMSGVVRGAEPEGDAFARNQRDLPPFVRSFYKKHRVFPTVENAMAYLHDNGLFSGDWSDNENSRAKRVSQILEVIKKTFDPKLLRTTESKPVELRRGKFSWWVRNHLGSRMKAKVVNLQGFDPVTLTAPTKRVLVPAKFIETFLVVADFCLNEDPLQNKAVPTNRIKKIWKMVVGGASWNQTYFQVVRDRLDRMGVVDIFDRNHDNNKAWRWDAGQNFPSETWKSETIRFRIGVSYQEFIANTNIVMDEQVLNTLYQTDARFQRLWDRNPDIRPPPT